MSFEFQLLCFLVEDAVDLMQRGAANRTIAETNMNTESSRSHCVMTIIIEGKVKDNIGTKNLFARLNLVDLAGRVHPVS